MELKELVIKIKEKKIAEEEKKQTVLKKYKNNKLTDKERLDRIEELLGLK